MINGTTLWNRSYTDDMIEKTFSGKTYLTYPKLPANLYDALSLSAVRFPGKTAVVDDSGRAYTYTELMDMTDQFSSYLYYIADITPGTRAGIMMFNSIEFCVAFLALTKLGAVVMPLPSKYSRDEVLSLAGRAGLRCILCDEAFYDWFVPLETSGVHLMKPRRSQDGFGFSYLCASYLGPVPSLGKEEDDALLLFTSGTTSQSKGAMIKNYSIMHAIVSYERIFRITDRDITLIPIPVYLVTGLVALLGLTLYCAGTVCLHKFFDAGRVLRDIRDKKITFLHAAPSVFSLLLREKDRFPSLPSLRLLACGSSNMSTEKLREIHQWLPCASFHTVYGLTETCSPAAIFPGDAAASSYIGSSGLPIPGTCFCILDDSGSQMQTGQTGEIAVRGTVLLDRYEGRGTGAGAGILGWKEEGEGWPLGWKGEDEGRPLTGALKGGWLRTGDLGYFNKEGYLFVVDRKKDMINRGGEKIWSFDVENELYRLEGVDEAAVVGIPHDLYGEIPAAAVKLAPHSSLTEKRIQELLRGRIANYMIPSRIIFLEELPLTPNSKVDKGAIRTLFMEPEQ